MGKRILIGVESFEELIEESYFYIDKTLLIKELLENKGKVTLITRPRRFGKTLNMSTLKCFFDTSKDNRDLFDGLKIMEHEDIVEKHMGKYPVVYMTLKDAESSAFDGSVEKIRDLVSSLYKQHLHILEGDRLDETDRELFLSFRKGKTTDIRLQSALKFLTECLQAYYKKKVIVLIDEYDTPINNALQEGHYQEMIKFMRGFLGSAFKSNDFLEFGVLTGVLRIAGESLVSSFNNPKVCGIMDKEFTSCFGFTEEEVKDACGIYGVGDKYEEIKRWYDGYRFGGQDMYNPWSIVRYLEAQEPDNYWVNTGSVHILQDVFDKGDSNLRDSLAGLLTGAPVMMSLEDGITYPIKYVNSDTFWTLLLNAGYLKPCNGAKTGRFMAELVNLEVKNILSRYAQNWFGEQQYSIPETILKFADNLLNGDSEAVSATLNEDLLSNPSSHDFIMENSYHMFIYGILLAVSGNYLVYSNREAGKGRSDCVIKPFDKSRSAVVVEFKHVKKLPPGGLMEEAKKGLEQIGEKAYVHELRKEGYVRIYKYGIAFHKKNCEVVMEDAPRWAAPTTHQ